MPRVGKLGADLVSPAGDQLTLYQRKAVFRGAAPLSAESSGVQRVIFTRTATPPAYNLHNPSMVITVFFQFKLQTLPADPQFLRRSGLVSVIFL